MNVKLWKGSRNDLLDPIGTIMENRGVKDYKTYMNLDDSCLNSPWELDNMEDAVRLLNKHIWNKSIISILVDCDVDGFTSASMMFQYLKTIGYFGKINVLHHSGKEHGLSKEIEVPPETTLLIIPDAGSNDVEQCKELREKGIDILILDHHICDRENPYAVIVNNQNGTYPNKELSGAGVVYKFLQAVDEYNWTDVADRYLDLVAVGNIGDVMDIHYFHPDMEPIFRSTYGVNIYQEQSMKLTKVFGGRNDAGADRMRKCLAKKKPEKVKEEVELLHDEIIANGYDKATAEYICNELSTKGGYGFNASHSQAYAVICLQTAYLKAHHPLAFFKAMLNLNKAKVGKVNKIMVDARGFDIQILPPSINRSGMDFTVSNGKILFGLSAIGGIGNTLAETIIAERDRNGKFKGLDDFTSRVRATKAQIIALVKSGAIPTKSKRIFLEKYIASGLEQSEFKPVSTLPTKAVLLSKWDIDTEHYKAGKKVDKETVLRIYNEKRRVVHETEKLKKKEAYMDEQTTKYLQDEELWEFQTLQTFISDPNPFEKAFAYIKDFSEIEEGDSCVLVGIIAKIQKKKTKTGMQFAFVNLYSGDGIIELTVWPRVLSDYQDLIVKGSQVAVLGKKEDESHVIASDFKPYKQWLHDREIK